jgi:phospholipase D-like protein
MGFGPWSLFSFAGVVMLVTIADLVRTRERARSWQSQVAWGFLTVFFPLIGGLFYWLTEARRRRRMTGEPADTA